MSSHRILSDLFKAPFRMAYPGNGGTVTVDRDRAVVPVVTTTSETLTLARPNRLGVTCTIELDTDGGDLTLTVTGGYNDAGTETLVLGTAGHFVTFFSVKVGSAFYWRVLASNAVKETTSVAEAAFVAGSGTAVNDNSTFGGYTIQQIVKALQNLEILT